MKRSGFKRPTYEEAIEKQRKVRLRRQKLAPKKRNTTKQKKVCKLANKGYKAPKWFKAIKPGAHGNNAHTKRVWRVVSETYREEDWNESPKCPCCNIKLESWQDGQLGHWLRYSLCKGWMKYERVNLAMICPGCNMKDDAITLKRLGEHLQMKYGPDVLDYIEHTNNHMKPTKIEEWQAVDYVAKLRPDLVD